jgi:hypothetical protein
MTRAFSLYGHSSALPNYINYTYDKGKIKELAL